MNPYYHAVSSAKKYGGKPEDYQAIHDWFDESKMMYANFRHRALRHHAEGCYMAERIFGHTITNSVGRKVPTRFIGEQHILEDLGFIPSVQDWMSNITAQDWMRPKFKDAETPTAPTGQKTLSLEMEIA